MTNVKADAGYIITIGDNSLLLDKKKFDLLQNIWDTGSIAHAAKNINISYRTALNYIEKIEETLDINIVSTKKGGKGGGGGTSLTDEGFYILKECKKINAIMELHNDVNELEATVTDINEDKGIIDIKIKDTVIKIPLNKNYKVGDELLVLISYDDIFITIEPHTSSIRNIMKGKVVEIQLKDKIIRVKIDVGGIFIYSDITVSAEKELNLTIGKEVYVAFKAMSVATLKL